MRLKAPGLKKRASIRTQLILWLCLFVGVMLLLLWLFQTVFLDTFYRSVKASSISKCADIISSEYTADDNAELLEAAARQYEVCMRIVDSNLDDVESAETIPHCTVHSMGKAELMMLYTRAQEAGGTLIDYYDLDAILKELEEENAELFSGNGRNKPGFFNERVNNSQFMICTKLITAADGSTHMLLLNARLSPVEATVSTLRVQLTYITFILIAFAVILALVMSRKISKPIISINESAKELAVGHYDTPFDQSGYKEVSELAGTLSYASAELGKTEELRRELMANISHDLRTPLTMITGYAEAMRDIPGENSPENIQIIVDEAKRLSDLVTDVLDLSRLESRSAEWRPERMSITQSIAALVSRLSRMRTDIKFSFEQESDAYVLADPIKLSQVLYNLLGNAVNYTSESVTVCQVTDGKKVRIEIIDDGEGIAAEDLPHIWERYYRVDKSHKRAVVGTGLGLCIVKNVLEQHGAAYGAKSEKGKGSTFWFEMTLA